MGAGYNTAMASKASKAAVLIVDDDPAERAALAQTLSSLGYTVENAADGEEALAKLDAPHRGHCHRLNDAPHGWI